VPPLPRTDYGILCYYRELRAFPSRPDLSTDFTSSAGDIAAMVPASIHAWIWSIQHPTLLIWWISNKFETLAVGTFGSIVRFGSAIGRFERRPFYGGFVLHASGQDVLSFFLEYHGIDFVQIGTRLHA